MIGYKIEANTLGSLFIKQYRHFMHQIRQYRLNILGFTIKADKIVKI